MSHDVHQFSPLWTPGQLLVDGCRECERRSVAEAITALDCQRFGAAWQRAAQWGRESLPVGERASRAELPVLAALWAVQQQLEKRGVAIGHVPVGEPL